MRIIILFILLCLGQTISAQQKFNIEGKWKIIGYINDEFITDLENGTIKMKDSSLSNNAMLELLREEILSSLPKGEFVFKKKFAFEERIDGKKEMQGTYSIDFKKRQITIKGIRNGYSIEDEYKFTYTNNEMTMTETKLDNQTSIILRKLNK